MPYKRLYTPQDAPEMRILSKRMAAMYGADTIKSALAACRGRTVYVFDDGGHVVGWQAEDENGRAYVQIGNCVEDPRPKLPPMPEFQGAAPVSIQHTQRRPAEDFDVTSPAYPENRRFMETAYAPQDEADRGGYRQEPHANMRNTPYRTTSEYVPQRISDSDTPAVEGGFVSMDTGMKRTPGKKKSKGAAGKVVAVIVILLLLLGVLGAVGMFVVKPALDSMAAAQTATDDDEPDYDSYTQIEPNALVHIPVESGDNVYLVREKMLDAGLVSAARGMEDAMRERGGTEALKIADYLVVGSEDASSIAKRMTSGITVPSGVIGINVGDDTRNIAENIDKASLSFTGADFLKEIENTGAYKGDYSMLADFPDEATSLEGYFPEGEYYLGGAGNASDAVRIMLDAAQSKFEELGVSSWQYHESLTIASLIEKEAMIEEDKPLISSVIANRLNEHMQLQIDATIKYATGSREAQVLYKDLDVESPYNTYRNFGLPPGPICSGISQSSLDAAMHPAETDYLYYVLQDKEGHHAFSTTLEQFTKDKEHYLEVFGLEDW